MTTIRDTLVVPRWVIEKLEAEAIRMYPREMLAYLVGTPGRVTEVVWPAYRSGYDWCEPVNGKPDGSLIEVHSHLDDKYFCVPSPDDLDGNPQGIVAVWHEDGELKAKTMFWPGFKPLEVEYV